MEMSSFYPLAIVNNALMNAGAQITGQGSAFNSLGCGIAGSQSNTILNLLQNQHAVSHRGCTILHSHQGSRRWLWLVLEGELTLPKSHVSRKGTSWYWFYSQFSLFCLYALYKSCWKLNALSPFIFLFKIFIYLAAVGSLLVVAYGI